MTKKKTRTTRKKGDPRKLGYMTASGPPRDERGRFISPYEEERSKPRFLDRFRRKK
ncbi:hypothetical protein [Candidatus Methanoprimaticola sp. MG2]|uniref:hypothetical protein n=1 Tax=Candidatus Methanoprimaticola sp. MG2 TaxID=3228838 RepID=UPI0039C75C49